MLLQPTLVVAVSVLLLLRSLKGGQESFTVRIGTIAILLSALLDLGLAPMATRLLDLQTRDPTILFGGSALDHEYPIAWYATALHYLSVLVAYLVCSHIMRKRGPVRGVLAQAHISEASRGGFAFICLAGAVVQVALLGILTRERGLIELASTRAMFSDESVVFTPLFGYLSTLAPAFKVGAFGLLATARTKRQRTVGIAACLLVVASDIALGGRTRALMTTVGALLVARLARDPIRLGTALSASLAVVLVLALASVVRFSEVDSATALRTTAESVLYQRRVEQTGIAIRMIPDRVPFLRGDSWVAGAAFLIPGLQIQGVNFYQFMMADFIGVAYVDRGVGGGNFSSAAESYGNFGWAGIVGFGLFFGGFFGSLLGSAARRTGAAEWRVIAAIGATTFFTGIDARPLASLVAFVPGVVLPAAFVSAYARPRLPVNAIFRLLFLVAALLVGLFVLGTGSQAIKWMAILAIAFTYLGAFAVLSRAGSTSSDQREK